MANFFKTMSFLASIIMLVFYGIYVSDFIFDYMPFATYISDYLGNIMYFGPMMVCALFSLSEMWEKSPITRWILLAFWVALFVASFLPGSVLDLFS
ncbi:MAG: hypothetical protein IJA61_00400 [Clostridia bacterium]|nr:hypothetical protein [Clostridia bacterium]